MSYMGPSTTTPLPGGLTLTQFIQTVLVGITGIEGKYVRPTWQINPPKQPDIDIDWIAFGVNVLTPDANGAIQVNPAGVTTYQRHELLEIACSIFGPNGEETAGILRDGFQIPANLAALKAANMGFTEVTQARHVPDLVNERWVNRLVMSVFIRRQVQRTYPIQTFLSANGTIHTVLGGEEYLLDWETQT